MEILDTLFDVSDLMNITDYNFRTQIQSMSYQPLLIFFEKVSVSKGCVMSKVANFLLVLPCHNW